MAALADQQARVRAMFDEIAPRYDRLNRALSFGQDVLWRRLAARRARLQRGELALDVGAGTGDLAFALLEASAAESRVVGLDPAGRMFELAMAKARRAGHAARFRAIQGSALDIPSPNGAYDRVVSAFTLRNVGDLPRACAEMRRVLRPGGRAVLLELSKPTAPLFSSLYRAYFYGVVPRLAPLLGGDRAAYAYLPASLTQFPDPRGLAELLQDTGFARVRYTHLSFGVAAIHEADA
jgi:demethylmenaquinone methyltransferase/2-methoxy-6-polyprenyl-1,4-benzoquinol methylase